MKIRTGLGSPVYADWTPPSESTATRRLEEAGAILIGKLLLFAHVYLMIVPALPAAGPSLAHMASLGEDPDAILAIAPFTAPFGVCGYPTITLPCGTSPRGVPVGFQVVAKPVVEDLLCRAAYASQGYTGWHTRRPDLHSFDSQNGAPG